MPATSSTVTVNLNFSDAFKQIDERYIPPTIQRVGDELIIPSSTPGSSKMFKVAVDDATNDQSPVLCVDGKPIVGLPTVTSADNGTVLKVVNGVWTAVASDGGGIPVVTTAGDGAAYTATVDGVTELYNGLTIIVIPNVTSTGWEHTLNVNGLGAKDITRMGSIHSGWNDYGNVEYILKAENPVIMTYNSYQDAWQVVNLTQPFVGDAAGTLAPNHGGTGLMNVGTGKYLVSNGDYDPMLLKTPNQVFTDIMPPVTTSDDGKLLQVVNGEWAAVDIGSAVELLAETGVAEPVTDGSAILTDANGIIYVL